jgi:hypothetical protein
MSEEQAAYNVEPASVDKPKLLKWLNNEIRSCNIVKHESDQIIRWECERIVERINAGLFDSSTISTETQWKIKLRVEELLKEKAQEQLKEAIEVLTEIRRITPYEMYHEMIDPVLSSLSQGTETNIMGIIKAGEYTYVSSEEKQITLRPELQWFAVQMELALRENDHKDGWNNCSQDWLLEQMYRNASKINKSRTCINKVINTANFAMMIADNLTPSESQEGAKCQKCGSIRLIAHPSDDKIFLCADCNHISQEGTCQHEYVDIEPNEVIQTSYQMCKKCHDVNWESQGMEGDHAKR